MPFCVEWIEDLHKYCCSIEFQELPPSRIVSYNFLVTKDKCVSR